MKLKIQTTKEFKNGLKRVKKRGYDVSLLIEVVDMISNCVELPEKYRDHNLRGEYRKYRECHIAPDWLLIYQVIENDLILILSETGTHSDLFR